MSTKIQAEQKVKKVPPKPENLKKKEERDTKYAQALKAARDARRVSNKAVRADVLARSQKHENAFQQFTRQQTELRRKVQPSWQLRLRRAVPFMCLPNPSSSSL